MSTRTLFAAALAVALAACAKDAPPADEAQANADSAAAAAAPAQPAGDQFVAPDTTQMKKSPTGLWIQDLHEGTGATLEAGQNAVVHYTGWFTNGEKFDSSRDRGEPFVVESVGQAAVIPAWNEGLIGMKVGGHRLLMAPPQLAYGEIGMPPAIPGNSTLVFMIELLDIK